METIKPFSDKNAIKLVAFGIDFDKQISDEDIISII